MNAPDLRGLSFVDALRGWAVGTNGTILRYDGTSWATQTSGITNTLNDIFMTSTTDGWLVGDDAALLRYRFGNWTSVELAPTMSDSYTAVFMLTSSQGHILGRNNTYLNYQGSTWEKDFNAPDVYGLTAISFGPGGTGWAAGENGDMLRYDVYWSHRQNVARPVYGIDMLSDTVGWAATDGGMYYTDARCTPTATECWHLDASRSYAGLILRGVHMLSSTDGWAVGDGGVILHWNGQSWATVREANPANPTLRRVVMVSPWEGWAVGDKGTILHYGGPQYALPPTATPTRTPTITQTPVPTASATATATGSPTASPTASPSPTPTATDSGSTNLTPAVWTAQTVGSEKLRAVSFPTGNQGWAVGANGAILHFDGSRWDAGQSVDPSVQLNSVAMISTTLGWAVGDGSIVLRYQDGAWQSYDDSSIPEDDYLVVRTVSNGDGWIFGAKGTLLRLEQGVWEDRSAYLEDGAPGVRDVVLSADGQNGWAAGDSGLLLDYTGNGWSKQGQRVFDHHYGVSVVPNDPGQAPPWVGWVVGQYRTGTSADLYLSTESCPAATSLCWQTYDYPPQATLYDVALLTPHDGWAVGQDGWIVHWDGAAWTRVASPTTSTLRALQFLSPSSGWAVGDQGTILRFAPPANAAGSKRAGIPRQG